MEDHGKPPDRQGDGSVEDHGVIDVTSPTPPENPNLSRSNTADVDMDEGAASASAPEVDEAATSGHDEAEQLTFAEMYAYLRSELTGLDVQRAKEVVNATEYAEVMFAEVFNARPRSHYQPIASTTRNSLTTRRTKCSASCSLI